MSLTLIKVVPLSDSAWKAVRKAYDQMEAMGWAAVQQAATVGKMLVALKKITPHGSFHSRLNEIKISQPTAWRLMQFAKHLPLLEKHKPSSQAQALELIEGQKSPKQAATFKKPIPVPVPKKAKLDGPDVEPPKAKLDAPVVKPPKALSNMTAKELYRVTYLFHVKTAAHFAAYPKCPVDQEMLARVHACTTAWGKVLLKMQEALEEKA